MKRWIAGLALLSACAEPAALEVNVRVEAFDLSAVQVRVLVQGKARVDCTVALQGQLQGLCPFEAGQAQWTDPSALSFVLYGDPLKDAELQLTGLRQQSVVSATVAAMQLPESPGLRGQMQVTLPGPSRPRARCQGSMPASILQPERVATDGAQSAMLVMPQGQADADGPLMLLVSAQNSLSAVTVAGQGSQCMVQARPLNDAVLSRRPGPNGGLWDALHNRGWCNLRPGAMVVRADQTREQGITVAGICANAGSPVQLKMARLGADGQTFINTAPISARLNDVSDPVLADTDGDGVPEASVFVRGGTGSTDALVRVWWQPGTAAQLSADVRALTSTSVGVEPPFSPLVLPGVDPQSAETLLMVGNSVVASRFTRGMLAAAAVPRSFRPPVARLVDARTVHVIVQSGLTTAQRVQMTWTNGLWAPSSRPELVTLLSTVPPSAAARPTVGRWGPALSPRVVLAHDDVAQLLDLQSLGAVETIDGWPGAGADAQSTLWVNLDGVPGPELLAYTQAGDRLVAWGASGAPRGWPLDFEGGAQPQFVVADLDGLDVHAGLRDLEIAALFADELKVVRLGPGSYDPQGFDWPTPDGTGSGSGLWTGASDPARAGP